MLDDTFNDPSCSFSSNGDDDDDESYDVEVLTATTPAMSDRESSSNLSGSTALARKETKAVNLSKLLMVFVLAVAAVSVSYMAYRLTKDSEESDFEGDVSILTPKSNRHVFATTSNTLILISHCFFDLT